MILIPKNCPVCDSVLDRVKDQLFCINSTCSAKSLKQLLHFSKVMKIKGLGEKTLEKLSLESINDIYASSLVELTSKLGDKIGTKLFNEINNSKIIDLATYITSFGIPLVGNSAGIKLSVNNKSIWDITKESAKESGIGDKAVDNLINWIYKNKEQYSVLPITTTVSAIAETKDILHSVVITGKLDDYSSRTKAKQFLESKGIKVLSTLSSKADYLICDTGATSSSSYKKAESLGIPVITMKTLINILGDDINVKSSTKME